ncbi:hypothetical protein PHYBLDRAFT_165793 [Phycomyces blakesleeanus NRRL 1555(-)]|uniref:WW domain-containing protein n=2 Tax=Phycomyces blakesleeanus TaxID=4837 RepID=A0A162UJW1_PHYB8|nr:hypothetical protein PHYBLDRAFT_165793 [Phycomyces blakesleeanus NRRL 1555(-)]OAD75813.1 hypothetical protein PHYBLDRAFT_165793 [Phycomyces blakesleeanus NRRL 1555(-)]|eukprot:XP_018293853.1 hypothetical protein PHYBLDRAFT_165793 [Phycomyces blakesleeanus NRRL 1555(-)]
MSASDSEQVTSQAETHVDEVPNDNGSEDSVVEKTNKTTETDANTSLDDSKTDEPAKHEIKQEKKETKGKGTDKAEKKIHPSKADIAKAWTAAWDQNSQSYYWWNTLTYETTWENPLGDGSKADSEQTEDYSLYYYGYPAVESSQTATRPDHVSDNPLDSLLDKIDTQVRSTFDDTVEQSPAEKTQTPYSSYFGTEDQYKFQAVFNAKTGKFQTSEEVERLHPDRMTIESRAKRQMQYYFDVDAYMDERNRERAAGAGQKRPLTKKDLDRFKKAKMEKKMKRARDWLCD